ncbi:hypothetical protein BLOT_008687 [Blomia tropicalis]|nr:hypothetical protein BLOT_008687 [Blomia tropicalis]
MAECKMTQKCVQLMLIFYFFSIHLLLFIVLIEGAADEPESTERPSRITRLLEMKDRIADRLCDRASSLLTKSLSNCGNATYCDTLKTITENLPVGCGIANESFNESIQQLAQCFRKLNRETCIDGIIADLNQKMEQLKAVGELASSG